MATMKDFSALQGLRRDLQEQEKARALALAERQRQEAAAREEANIFRNSIGQVAPLRPEVVDK
ncbi:hypothetical protein ABTF55_21030, partial [Acinetobacter baumannii]